MRLDIKIVISLKISQVVIQQCCQAAYCHNIRGTQKAHKIIHFFLFHIEGHIKLEQYSEKGTCAPCGVEQTPIWITWNMNVWWIDIHQDEVL